LWRLKKKRGRYSAQGERKGWCRWKKKRGKCALASGGKTDGYAGGEEIARAEAHLGTCQETGTEKKKAETLMKRKSEGSDKS